VSPVVAEGEHVPVPGPSGLSIWLPADWEVVEGQMFELLALGPVEPTYRANLSIIHLNVDAALTLEEIAEAAARLQARTLDTFVEYDQRPVQVADLAAIQREYGWVQNDTELVLYQLELLALDERIATNGDSAALPRLLEVHATSAAPAYFRYAALLRRMLESIQRQPGT
jgi:hypothetical protein